MKASIFGRKLAARTELGPRVTYDFVDHRRRIETMFKALAMMISPHTATISRGKVDSEPHSLWAQTARVRPLSKRPLLARVESRKQRLSFSEKLDFSYENIVLC